MVRPSGVRANSWQDVSDLSSSLGVQLDAWQELILEAAMGERSDRTWAAKRVGVTLPRQNGKSQLMVARILAGALLFGEKKIVVSAHQQDTAREAFAKLMEIIEADENAALRSRVKSVMNALNRESVKFTTGAVVQFKARSGAAGKGFSSDCLLLDEAQILGSRAWTSINSTMSAMRNPQVWLLGTAPQEEDDSYTFDLVRKAALGGVSTSAAWCEWGADPNSPDYDPASEYTRWTANPAWNTRINHEVVEGEFETYSVDRFAQDRLGVWRSDVAPGSRAIDAEVWTRQAVAAKPDGPQSYGVAFSVDGSRVSLAGGVRAGGKVHVELIDSQTGGVDAGVAALADWLADRRHTLQQIAIAGADGGPALVRALLDRRVSRRRIRLVTTTEYGASCSMLLDGLKDGSVTHLASDGQKALDDSVAVSDKKPFGTAGAWRWNATTPDGDKTPVEAIGLANWAARSVRQQDRGGAVFA